MKSWWLWLIPLLIIAIFLQFGKKPQIKKSIEIPKVVLPTPGALKKTEEARLTKQIVVKTPDKLSAEECKLFNEEQVYKVQATSFNCFIYDFWSSYDLGENDVTLTLRLEPKDYLKTLGQTAPLNVEFKVESTNKELADLNQEFAHTFHANLKNFKLHFENPLIADFVYNQLNLDRENESEKLRRTFTGYKEYCKHINDPDQYLILDTQWTSMGVEGVVKIPSKNGLFKIKFEGGSKQESTCLPL
jgi:hypothetical protein